MSSDRLRRLLITGASGFIGRHLVREAVACGGEVACLGLGNANASTTHLTVFKCDLRDGDRVQAIVGTFQPTTIMHLAAAGVAYGRDNDACVWETNVDGFRHLLDAAAALPQTPQVIAAGSGMEYTPTSAPLRENDPEDPPTIYGKSKLAATRLARKYADRVPCTILRMFSSYGVGESPSRFVAHIVHQAKLNRPANLSPGRQIRDYTNACDLAHAFFVAARHVDAEESFCLFNVGTGQSMELRQLGEWVAEALAARGIQAQLNFGALPYREDEMMHFFPDTSLWKRTFPWSPSTDIQASVRSCIDKMLCDWRN